MFRYLILIMILSITLAGCTEQVKVDMQGAGETIPTGSTGIAFDGKDLLVAKEGLIAFIDNIDTATAGSIYGYEGHFYFDRYPITITSKENKPYITGLAWQNTAGNTGFIWASDEANRRILKISPQGDVITRIPLTKIYPEDITFDGEYLWVVDSKRKKIFKLSTEDGSIVSEYLSPVPVPTALAWDGKNLIVGGLKNLNNPAPSPDNVQIIKLDPVSGNVMENVETSRYLTSPAGMVWINGKLWISDRNSGKIVIISDKGEPSTDIRSYKLPAVAPVLKKVEAKEDKNKTAQDVDEAKRAAEEARKAAEEAKKAAEAAKKAFELQQKK
ncbi:hypothetical protein [Thermodesulfovibrio thiophilus]|uniref:hypothetical protein n=1 Tax=Thermodesulfovibrio thiophilus TaxID=340095 RepID=UPI00041E2552|nr:hypothetical protein [Thermodesulfovibrio thiophilus]